MSQIDFRPTGVICYLTTALLFQTAVAGKPKQDTLTAKEILERMTKTYAESKTYRDSGTVRTFTADMDDDRIQLGKEHLRNEMAFRTAFVRPDRFRFEYKKIEGSKRGQPYVIWRKGKEVQAWLGTKTTRPHSVGWALTSVSGGSGGSSRHVPALLSVDEEGELRPTHFIEARRIEDSKFEKVDCFRILGLSVDHLMTLWIDKRTFLLRKNVLRMKFDDFSSVTIKTYEPVMNGEISDEMLKFAPPQSD